MTRKEKKSLEKAGWKVGTVEEFLGLVDPDHALLLFGETQRWWISERSLLSQFFQFHSLLLANGIHVAASWRYDEYQHIERSSDILSSLRRLEQGGFVKKLQDLDDPVEGPMYSFVRFPKNDRRADALKSHKKHNPEAHAIMKSVIDGRSRP